MTNGRVSVITAGVLLGACGLLSCGASPPTRYFTLEAVAPSAASGAAQIGHAAAGVPVRLQSVSIPPELDRPELVRRSGPYRVSIDDLERWAAPLDDQIRRVLSDDLAARLPPLLVADPSETATAKPRRLLFVAISDFSVDESCAATLYADWTLRGPQGDEVRGSERVQLPAAGSCTTAVPAAMSHALAVLADRLAAVIAGPAGGS